MAPQNAYLTITGLETLPLRGEALRERSQGSRVARRGPSRAWVSYAGLPSYPYHELSNKYMPRGAVQCYFRS